MSYSDIIIMPAPFIPSDLSISALLVYGTIRKPSASALKVAVFQTEEGSNQGPTW
jgi:hypothetical protein